MYGFENGDRVIKYLAKCIKAAVPPDHFVGHVGGDDFVAIVKVSDTEEICERLIQTFDETISAFYTQRDAQNGYIITKNRQGREEQYPLLSLSVAGIRAQCGRFSDVFSLSAEASRIKKECKVIPGSTFLIL